MFTAASQLFAWVAGTQSPWRLNDRLSCVAHARCRDTELYILADEPWSAEGVLIAVTGSVTVNTAPPPGPDAASTFPLCSRRMALQMLKPRPVPRPGRFVV